MNTKIYNHLEKESTKEDHPVSECRKWDCKMPPVKYAPPEQPKEYTLDDHPVRMCKQFKCKAKSLLIW